MTENQRKTQISWQRQFHSALFCEHSEMLWHWVILNSECRRMCVVNVGVNGGEKKDSLIIFPLTQHSQHLSLYKIHINFNIKIRRKYFCITLNVTCKVLWLGQLQWKTNDELKTKEHFPFFDIRITFRKQISQSLVSNRICHPWISDCDTRTNAWPSFACWINFKLLLGVRLFLHNKTMHICPLTCIDVYMCKLATGLLVLIEIARKL